MKYSEAIREGIKLGPQAFGMSETTDGAMCANRGAARAARIGEAASLPLAHMRMQCPSCGRKDELVGIVALCLNDAHRWTRERIADFVEGVENAQDQPAEIERVGATTGAGRS